MKNALIKTSVFIVLVLLITLAACKSGDTKKDDKKGDEPSKAEIFVPDFNSDSAYYYVQRQVDFGPRAPGTKAHTECAKWLVKTLERFTPHVQVQNFKARIYNNETYNGKNIIASFNPDNKDRILLCAHWDTRPFADHDPNPENHNTPIDGANDGASGVGVLLEVARQFHKHNPEIGVDIIFFDLEDFGQPQTLQLQIRDDWCLGSQHWSKSPHKIGYRAKYGILLDMVGVSNPVFAQEGMSMHFGPHIVNKVWNIAKKLGYGKYFVDTRAPSIIDDHYYVNEIIKIPTIDIIHYQEFSRSGFFPYWHTINDTMEHVDQETLDMVGTVVLTTIYWE